jgi:hypothetical protein
MTETNRIEYKKELTSELDIEKEVVALFHTHFRSLRVDVTSTHLLICGFP